MTCNLFHGQGDLFKGEAHSGDGQSKCTGGGKKRKDEDARNGHAWSSNRGNQCSML